MKNLILLLSLAFPMILGAQQWEMKLDMPSVFVDGVINESDEAIVAGLCYNTDDEEMHIWVRRDEAMYDDRIDDVLYGFDRSDISPKFDYHY